MILKFNIVGISPKRRIFFCPILFYCKLKNLRRLAEVLNILTIKILRKNFGKSHILRVERLFVANGVMQIN